MTQKKALIVYGGWNGHEPEKTTARWAGVLERHGLNVTTSSSLDAFLEAANYDLILPNWTMGTLEGEQERALEAAVRGGVGLAGWHGGMGDAFRGSPAYQYMVGGQWVAHPGNGVEYTVHILPTGDPITAGLEDFVVRSEQYYLHTDPSNEVLATTTFSGEHDAWIAGTTMPVAWKRHYGAGRVFYSSLGHQDHEFDVPETAALLERGLLWAARG